jgi:phosphopantetheine adenylyltransferase
MMPKENHSYVSSSIVKQVARLGGSTRDFVPESVQRMLRRKLSRIGARSREGQAP